MKGFYRKALGHREWGFNFLYQLAGTMMIINSDIKVQLKTYCELSEINDVVKSKDK